MSKNKEVRMSQMRRIKKREVGMRMREVRVNMEVKKRKVRGRLVGVRVRGWVGEKRAWVVV